MQVNANTPRLTDGTDAALRDRVRDGQVLGGGRVPSGPGGGMCCAQYIGLDDGGTRPAAHHPIQRYAIMQGDVSMRRSTAIALVAALVCLAPGALEAQGQGRRVEQEPRREQPAARPEPRREPAAEPRRQEPQRERPSPQAEPARPAPRSTGEPQLKRRKP